MSAIFICDFDDSFTYNIFSQLKGMDSSLDIQVVNHSELETLTESLSTRKEKAAVILGPGPGKVSDYKKHLTSIKKLLEMKSIFVLGVCLGHQLIWDIIGGEQSHAVRKVHGQVEAYSNKCEPQLASEFTVQRYNSLVVKLNDDQISELKKRKWTLIFSSENELIFSHWNRIASMQFHPESIGTVDGEQFYYRMFDFFNRKV